MANSLENREALVHKLQSYEDDICKYTNEEQFRKIIEKLFVTKGINIDNIELIKSQKSRYERVSALLYYIYSSDTKIINTFLDVLQIESPHLYTEITGKNGNFDKNEDEKNAIFYERLKLSSNSVTSKIENKCCDHEKEIANLKQEIIKLKDEKEKLIEKTEEMQRNIIDLEYNIRFEQQNVKVLRFLRHKERASLRIEQNRLDDVYINEPYCTEPYFAPVLYKE